MSASPTYLELLAQIKQLQAAADEVRNAEIQTARLKIRNIMAENGLAPADVFDNLTLKVTKASGDARRNPVPAKYRDAESGKTWTGRGKPPLWISGKDRAEFLINSAE